MRDVDRRLRQALHLGEVDDLRLDRELLLRREPVELEAALADGLDVLGPRIDQRDVVAEVGEGAADIAAERAGAYDCNSFWHIVGG